MLLQADSVSIALARGTLYWTKVQGISTIIIAALGFSGVALFVITRWGLLDQVRRAKVEDAIHLCEEMRKEIVPMLERLSANLVENKIPIFASDASKISFSPEIDEAKAEKALAWVERLNPEARGLACNRHHAIRSDHHAA